ncbi:ABC transporter ATP-binding protein [Streptomyces palmae]|uniref:ABC transporter ATP-binding protein n=1 Tax=Streptomyces palmae TaxID=1701085 RepID=A0A4Z0GGM2_9ACTN|nr:ABC transporter ATP-binding protein [Streptomyces palmae]TGA95635.1 ABC transporter ATP-binding protein [Streptomyces palmae]
MVAPPDDDVLWARGITYAYSGSPALTGVSFGVHEGEVVALTGPRGCGKTTLLECLSGRLLPDDGEVWFNGSPVHTLTQLGRERLRREHFGWIDPAPRLVPELTVWENVALPMMLRGTPRRTARTTAREWLDRLDVGDRERERPAALLQSQRQRVAIARALAATPKVLFADEPTAPLHHDDRGQVLRTLTAAARSHGITVLLATHDSEVAPLADQTVALLDGRRVGAIPAPDAEGRDACSVSA